MSGGTDSIRLNLINHLVDFILCQFAYNSAFRNPVFRWELCKDSVWKSVKKCSRLCSEVETRSWQAARRCTQVKHTEKLNRHASYSSTGQKVQTGHLVSSRLGLATQSSHQSTLLWKNWLFAFLSHSNINTPYSHEILRAFKREFWERNPREKQDWLIHNLYIVTLQILQLSPSPLLHSWEVH